MSQEVRDRKSSGEDLPLKYKKVPMSGSPEEKLEVFLRPKKRGKTTHFKRKTITPNSGPFESNSFFFLIITFFDYLTWFCW